ncbi:MAG: GNAT family N-acetyltransferase [Burkholderiales bacterium]
MQDYQIREVGWQEAQHELKRVRKEVFIVEQNVPVELEWDGLDPEARHVLAQSRNGEAMGTARLLPDGQIGRMAVLKEWRGLGVGSALLEALLQMARTRGFSKVFLNSQTRAIAFYSRHGFKVASGKFMDAGIPHVRMVLHL